MHPHVSGSLTAELLPGIPRMCRIANFVWQGKPDCSRFRGVDIDRDANIETTVNPLVDPRGPDRVSGNAEVVRYDGFNFVGMIVQISAEFQSLLGV